MANGTDQGFFESGPAFRARQQKQQTNEALQRAGYVLDDTGNVQFADGGLPQAVPGSELNQQQMANQNAIIQQQAQMSILQNHMVKEGIQTALENYQQSGNASSMQDVIKSNPFLKQKLESTFGISEVSPINFDDKTDLALLEGLDEEGIDINDPETKSLINEGFFKIRDAQGNYRLADIDDIQGLIDPVSEKGKKLASDFRLLQERLQTSLVNKKQLKTAERRNLEFLRQLKEERDQFEPGTLEYEKANEDVQSFEGFTKTSQGLKTEEKKEYLDVVNKVQDEEQVETTDLFKAMQYEQDNAKFFGKSVQDQIELIGATKGMVKTFNDLRNLDDTDVVRTLDKPVELLQGLKEKFVSVDPNKYRGPNGNLNTDAILADPANALATNKIILETKVGKMLAEYLKLISGTAVADAEFRRIQKILTSGDITNVPSLLTAMHTFMDESINTLENKVEVNKKFIPATSQTMAGDLAEIREALGEAPQFKDIEQGKIVGEVAKGQQGKKVLSMDDILNTEGAF